MCRYNLGGFNDVDSDEIMIIMRNERDLAKEMNNIKQTFDQDYGKVGGDQ